MIDLTTVPMAVVTGGASGIGLCIARLFLEHRWAVTLVDNDVTQGEKAACELGQTGQVCFMACDVSRPDDVRQVISSCASKFGRINAVVNNAGTLGPEDLLQSYNQDIEKVIAVNLLGCIWTCKYTIEHMVQAGGGVIINVGSISSIRGAPNFPAYAASKAGLIGLTKSLARRYARHNVRVNCVSLGSVGDTKLRFHSQLRKYSTSSELALAANIPIGRTLRAREVADLIFTLASPVAAAMTGTNVIFDGAESLGR